MRGILTSLVLVIALSVRRAECATWIECDANVMCTEHDRRQFAEKQALYKLLLEANRLSSIGPFVERNSLLMQAVANRTSLCTDTNMAGFLANDTVATESWPITCLWSGADSTGVCSPAPPIDAENGYDYLKAEDWSKRIKSFRKSIGCSSDHIALAEHTGELYLCRERCVQLGLGEYNSAIASFAFISSVMVLILLS